MQTLFKEGGAHRYLQQHAYSSKFGSCGCLGGRDVAIVCGRSGPTKDVPKTQ